jgi:hypothetical protein
MVLFNPFGYNPTDDWKDQLLHPKIHVGASIGTTHTAAKQIRPPDTDVVQRPFHGGRLRRRGSTRQPLRRERWSEARPPRLFHEYVGAGYSFDSHWSLMAQVNHSSHADLCDGPNAGMTMAGLLVGYGF